jgi:hypothetical protein
MEPSGLLVLTQGIQGAAELAGCAQCVGMVLAQDPAAAGERFSTDSSQLTAGMTRVPG